MRYLTDAERRDFADIIKTYIKKMWSTAKTPGHHHRKISFKPFMLTKEKIDLLVSRGLKDSVLPDYWGSVSKKEDFVVCRSKESGLPISIATRVPAYAGVALGFPGGQFDLIARRDVVRVKSHGGKYGPTSFSWDLQQALAAIHVLENSDKVPSKMLMEMMYENEYNTLLSQLEMPVRYFSVSIRPGRVARLDDPEILDPPFEGHFDKKHEHLLDDLIHSEALSGGSLILDAVEIVRAKWMKKERFADMFHLMARSKGFGSHVTDMIVAWEPDDRRVPLGRVAMENFRMGPMVGKFQTSDFEAVLEGDRLVDRYVLVKMAALSQERFFSIYQNKSYLHEFIYEGPNRIVDPR